MAFSPFPNQQYVRILDTDTVASCGYVQTGSSFELQSVRMRIFILGALSGTEQLRLHCYGSFNSATPIASSAWIDLADVGTYSPNFIGEIFFEFSNSIPMNPNNLYHFKLEPQNYTRVGTLLTDTFFVGFCLDWYDQLNDYVSVDAGARMALLGLA